MNKDDCRDVATITIYILKYIIIFTQFCLVCCMVAVIQIFYCLTKE